MGFLKRIALLPGQLLGLVFPMFSRARGSGGARAVLRWVVHLLILAAILAGLAWLNHALRLDRYVRAPLPILRTAWLPLLFLLFYALCWLGWLLWRSLGPERDASEFPDIEQAWDEAMQALAEANIAPTEAPLFLVLGRPIGGEKSLFNAAQLKLQVKQAPRRPDAPLSVSANQDGIFVAAAGASLLGRFADLVNGRTASPARPAAELEGSRSSDELPPADRLTAEFAAWSTDEFDAFGTTSRRRSLLLKDGAEVERLSARLRHLCRLIARDRRPYCPINGILVLIPYAATGDDSAAKEAASLCHRELEAVREALQVHCPTFALVCDFERAEGFDEFLKFFPEGQRRRFLGQQFPLVPDLDASATVRMIEKGVQWVGGVLFPSLVYRSWGPEGPGGEEAEATAINVRLYRFVRQLRDRLKRLGRIVTRGVVIQARGPAMLGGCGFAATGRDLVREQGFAAGVVRLLLENQNHVSWSRDALGAEADYRRWERIGYAGIGAFAAALLALGYVLWPRS